VQNKEMDIEMKIVGKLNMAAWISHKIQKISSSHKFRTTWCLFLYVLKMQ